MRNALTVTVPALLVLLAACDFDNKHCIGDCPGLSDTDTSDGTTAEPDVGPGGELGSCEIVDTIETPPFCGDGVIQPGELCIDGVFSHSGLGPITSSVALQLDSQYGPDILYTYDDGRVGLDLLPPQSPKTEIWPAGTVPMPLTLKAAGDFNEDGNVDVLSYHVNEGHYAGVTLLLDGEGGLLGHYVQFLSGSLVTLDAADWDGDGHLDLVALIDSETQLDNLVVHLGDGTGEFAPTTAPVVPDPSAVHALGALDDDGRGDDFVFASAGATIVRHHGGQQSVEPLDLPPELSLIDLRIADVDGDGLGDVLGLASNSAHGTSEVVVALQAGGFAATRYPVGCGAHAFAVGDLDGDGLLDLATAGDDFYATVRANDGQGGFAAVKTVPADKLGPGDRLFIADFEGDGLGDLAGTNAAQGAVFVAFNRP